MPARLHSAHAKECIRERLGQRTASPKRIRALNERTGLKRIALSVLVSGKTLIVLTRAHREIQSVVARLAK